MELFAGNRMVNSGVLACAVMWLLSTVALAQPAPETKQDAEAQQHVGAEVYKRPQVKSIQEPLYRKPICASCWVELALMVDAEGKPFEVVAIRSSGSKDLEREATAAIYQAVFQPGTLDGKPVESVYELKYLFHTVSGIPWPASGVLREPDPPKKKFLTSYNALLESIKAGDRAAADAVKQKLRITTLTEDAYFGFASYKYAAKWGDESEQLDGLRRAIAQEDTARYLPLEMFRYALLWCLQLELKAHQYAEALSTAKTLEKTGVDPETGTELKAAMEKLDKLRNDNTSYEVAGSIAERSWFLHLFKQHFRAVVSEGNISEAKLRCERRYGHFPFDSNVQYQVSTSKDGACSIELVGSPGTRFRFVQF